MIPDGLLHRRFRASSEFDLVSLERLTETERTAVADLLQRPDVYGVVKPRMALQSVKVVDPETALLLLALREPGPLPHFARMRLEDASSLYQLVLDSLLEIEIDGRFVSGPQAYAELSPLSALVLDGTRLAETSLRALRYGAALAIDDPARLSARLYCYGRMPPTPRWQATFGTPDALLGYRDTPASPTLRDRIRVAWSRSDEPGWVYCSRGANPGARKPSHKLYVSPAPGATLEVLSGAVAALEDTAAHSFKFGRDVLGMLRPDKFVAYFAEHEALMQAAERVRAALAGAPAHGVPFSSQIGEAPLLSWGADPPRTEHLVGWQERPSWRLWVTNRLAVALLSARAAFANDVEKRAAYALDRLRLEGIDVKTWTPARHLFD